MAPRKKSAPAAGGSRGWFTEYLIEGPSGGRDNPVEIKILMNVHGLEGRVSDVIELTFEGVGVTPENRYEVFVARDTRCPSRCSWFRGP